MSEQPGEDTIAARKQAAGRLGFIFGCLAAVGAAIVNLHRASGPVTLAQAVIFVLMAALNVPFWIGLGLLIERVSRPK